MKRSEINAWTAALRSGDYKQGTGALRGVESEGNYRFCCLGVLCEIDPDVKLTESGDYKYGKDIETNYLPLPYTEVKNFNEFTGLISLDTGEEIFTFKQILRQYRESPFAGQCIKECNRRANANEKVLITLTTLNDGGLPFSAIADIIDKLAYKLFTNIEEDVK